MVSPETVREVLRSINDPEMPINIVDLGIVNDVAILPMATGAGAQVKIDLLPTFVGCPALDAIAQDVRRAVGALPGVAEVAVRFIFDPPWTIDRITPQGRAALQPIGVTVPDATEPTCPFCGSSAVHRESAFGPTRCRMIYYCDSCRNPFERLKRIPLPTVAKSEDAA